MSSATFIIFFYVNAILFVETIKILVDLDGKELQFTFFLLSLFGFWHLFFKSIRA